MRREGSPWQGLGTVTMKEFSDHLSSARMIVLETIVILIAVATVLMAAKQIQDTTAEDPFLFLRLFTTSQGYVPSFVFFLTFLVPLMAIGFGFDAVNSEYNRRTLSRVLSQPIYRDALLFGKFIAGLLTLAVGFTVLWLLLIGLGLLQLGIPPNAEEMGRAVVFLLVTIAYGGVWLALALLFSILFRSAATAALMSLGLWLFLTFIWPSLAGPAVIGIMGPDDPVAAVTVLQPLLRLSPGTLFGEIVQAILDPSTRSLGAFAPNALQLLRQGAIPGAPLPLGESLLIAWPQIVGLVAGAIILFVIGYIAFQRQEVRA